MARPGSEWWRLLRRRSQGTYPDRLPGDDHVSLWLRERKPEVYVSQPYGLTSDVAAEMLRAAEFYGLKFTISTWPAWWNPGAVLFVECGAQSAPEERMAATFLRDPAAILTTTTPSEDDHGCSDSARRARRGKSYLSARAGTGGG
jgi:hypothetical protein